MLSTFSSCTISWLSPRSSWNSCLFNSSSSITWLSPSSWFSRNNKMNVLPFNTCGLKFLVFLDDEDLVGSFFFLCLQFYWVGFSVPKPFPEYLKTPLKMSLKNKTLGHFEKQYKDWNLFKDCQPLFEREEGVQEDEEREARCCTYARWKAIPQKQHHLKKEKRKRLRKEIASRTLFGKGAARQ